MTELIQTCNQFFKMWEKQDQGVGLHLSGLKACALVSLQMASLN